MRKLNDTELELINSISALLKRYNSEIKGIEKKVNKNVKIVSDDGMIDVTLDEVLIILALKKYS